MIRPFVRATTAYRRRAFGRLQFSNVLEVIETDDETISAEEGRTQTLTNELKASPFTIFAPIQDHGFFGEVSSKRINSGCSLQQFQKRIRLEAQPRSLIPLGSIRFPEKLVSMLPTGVDILPDGGYEFSSLYVAHVHRGATPLDEIEFLFGGSTLEMLATKYIKYSCPFLATRIPHTNTILVVPARVYTRNDARPEGQFERLVTGKNIVKGMPEEVTHMHRMKVGPYNVLFRARVDAIHKERLVKVVGTNPRNWGTRIMFQMISNGSTSMCCPNMEFNHFESISVLTLSLVIKSALRRTPVQDLERNILQGISDIKEQMEGVKAGELREITYDVNQKTLHLIQPKSKLPFSFPNSKVIEVMLKENEYNSHLPKDK